MQPAQAIHPRVESVFSVPNIRMEQEEPDQSVAIGETSSPESETLNEEKPPQVKPHTAPFRQEVEKAASASATQSSQPTAPGQNQPTSFTFQPLFVDRTATDSANEAPSVRQPGDAERKTTPSAVVPVRATPMTVPHPALHRPLTIAQSQHMADAPTRSRSEPEEIQIHIGRIEVSAMPPAPAPAAVKTPRKSSSLDDYLRRRDRRTL
jgi:hypothetical protein